MITRVRHSFHLLTLHLPNCWTKDLWGRNVALYSCHFGLCRLEVWWIVRPMHLLGDSLCHPIHPFWWASSGCRFSMTVLPVWAYWRQRRPLLLPLLLFVDSMAVPRKTSHRCRLARRALASFFLHRAESRWQAVAQQKREEERSEREWEWDEWGGKTVEPKKILIKVKGMKQN